VCDILVVDVSVDLCWFVMFVKGFIVWVVISGEVAVNFDMGVLWLMFGILCYIVYCNE